MVKEIKYDGKIYYMCEACDMYYKNQKMAQECEDFCNKYKSCNTDLINHAVEIKNKPNY